MTFYKKRNNGFTLIELLVVIAIIGVLATLIISSLAEARERSKVARFHAELKNLQTGLELYYAEHGHYPYNSTKTNPYQYDFFANSSGPGTTWRNEFSNKMKDYFDTESFAESIPSSLNAMLYYRNPCNYNSVDLNTKPQGYNLQFSMSNGHQLEPYYNWTNSADGSTHHRLCSPQ